MIALKIHQIKQMYQINKLFVIKLLHRQETSKFVLESCVDQNIKYAKQSFCNNVRALALECNSDLDHMIWYPDMIIEKINEDFDNNNEDIFNG